MTKPNANFPNVALPSYQELGTANDTNGSFTQLSQVATNAGYAASGAVNITAAGTPFTNWPSYGFIQNIRTSEIMFYNNITGNNTLVVLSVGRGLAGSSAAAGLNADNINFIEARVLGKVVNQILAEITALESALTGTTDVSAGGGAGSTTVLTASQSHQKFTNVGATGLQIFDLPAAAKGLKFKFFCENVNGVKVVPLTSDVIVDGNIISTNGTGNGFIQSVDAGAVCELEGMSNGKWIISSSKGTWSVT